MTNQVAQGPHLRPENALTQAPVAAYEGAVLYTPPTMGYYWGWIAYYAPERLDSMLKEVGERTAKMALTAFDIAIKAMGVHEPGPQERLELYRVKSPDLWAEQKMKFPWRYEHDMADWAKLEQQHPLTPPPETLPEVTGGSFYSQESPNVGA